MNFRRLSSNLTRSLCVVGAATLLSQCTTSKVDRNANVVVSVKEQKLALYSSNGTRLKEYPVSTSKFGLNDKPGAYGTPLGRHEIVAKIGQGVKPGSVFKSRQLTGEVLKPDAPGRDPIVTRIMWLRGMESQNKNAYGRCIYIHGTAEERNVGKPVSYGCIRMKSKDVVDVFDRTSIGSNVLVVEGKLPGHVPAAMPSPLPATPENAPPIFLSPNPNMQGPLGKPEGTEAMLAQSKQVAPVSAPASTTAPVSHAAPSGPAPELAANTTPSAAPAKRSLFNFGNMLRRLSPEEEAVSAPAPAPVSTHAAHAHAPAVAAAPSNGSPSPALASEEETPVPGSESSAGNFASRRLQSGATVIYSAASATPATPVVLKSKRTTPQKKVAAATP
ncbi:L,D-transpeptidase family protein [Verrucomicrobium sp. BvORR106]|uniref:L,D-transpeptidase family protein n=1 Tax=Verrucomicrobium sp. BvORR106 TaxID=1403819 RepID=UPI00068DDF91|nr:L,D-transpeptidase family protein [Verrucomicrobium sp. BvORR106]